MNRLGKVILDSIMGPESPKAKKQTIHDIQGRGFTAAIIRTNRKKSSTVRVQEGKVSLIVPRHVSHQYVQELLTKKTPWIKKKLLLQRQGPRIRPKKYITGESISYLGKNYPLRLEAAASSWVKLIGGRFVVGSPQPFQPDGIKVDLTDWFIAHAEARLTEKVEYYSRILDVSPSAVIIKTFKARWGSCSNRGKIQFNWKIIIAPNRIIDYVVVHELCHLRHLNHSPAFWHSVEQVIPDYRESNHWLRTNGHSLEI